MGLTLSRGPLAEQRSPEVNYRIDGPDRLLFFGDFPRRVRARFGGQTVFDTRTGRLLHETGLLPVLYVPESDVTAALLEESRHTTHCPFKGEAAYWNIRVGDRTAKNAVWAYPAPVPGAAWLRGYQAFSWESMDAWYDEGEQVHGHLRDPYHRVDVRVCDDRVRVWAGERLLAESTAAMVLSETGLPNRYYLPRRDVRVELAPSSTSMVCPYKGVSSYWHVPELPDAAWSYEEPLPDAVKISRYVCFGHDGVRTEVQ